MLFKIDLNDSMKKVIQSVNLKRTKVVKATVRALNSTALWAREKAIKELCRDKQIQQKVVKQRLWIKRATRNNERAILKVGLQGIKAGKLGNMKQMIEGARAGKYMFKGAFIATMKTGHKGIFMRRYVTSLPIYEVKVPIEEKVIEIAEGIASYNTEKVFEKYFLEQIKLLGGS